MGNLKEKVNKMIVGKTESDTRDVLEQLLYIDDPFLSETVEVSSDKKIKGTQGKFKDEEGTLFGIKVTRFREKLFDKRHKKIIDEVIPYSTILEVGPGSGKLVFYLLREGKKVSLLELNSTQDLEILREFCDACDYTCPFYLGSIALSSILELLPTKYEAVIASEVIEHITDYKKAIENLISLATEKVVLTTPVGDSYSSPEHVHLFQEKDFLFIKKKLGYKYAITSMRTKYTDCFKDWKDFVVVIDVKSKERVC